MAVNGNRRTEYMSIRCSQGAYRCKRTPESLLSGLEWRWEYRYIQETTER
jgi:hypothetical protein